MRTAFGRSCEAIELRPGIALGTMKTKTRLEHGVKGVIRNGYQESVRYVKPIHDTSRGE